MNIPDKIIDLYTGDPRVVCLLGNQRKYKVDKLLRKSMFVYRLYLDDHYLLFHTLTRQMLLIEPEMIEWFMEERRFSADILQNETAAWLYDHYFLVPEDEQECRTYMEVKDLIILKEERPDEMVSYVILPTTVCNARCFYCFEHGMRYHHMTEETVQDTIRFILEHRPKHNRIHIHWFGGEPTIAPDIIDRICDGLTDAGVIFDAEMTSNGSLLNKELSRHAKEKWNVNKIQITLDGTEKEYVRRKQYVSAVKDPFHTVISNIHTLLKENIRVCIRLNADENNIGDLYRCVNFLNLEFDVEEKKKLWVYAHTLFGEPGEIWNACPAGSASDELEEAVNNLNHYMVKTGLTPRDMYFVLRLKSSYCMVTVPENGAVIDADGNLFACEAMPENLRYGDVKNGINPVCWKEIVRPDKIRDHCRTCTFLPQCTEFCRCLNRKTFDDCRKHEERVLKNDLRYTYSFLLEQEKQKTEKSNSEQQETGVPTADVQH